MEAVGEIVSDEVTAGLHVAEASVEIAGEPVTDAAVAAQIAAQHAASTAQLHLSTVASDASAAVQMAMAAALAAGGAPVVPGSAPPFALGPQDQNIGLTMKSYEEVACPEELAQGRAGGALGAGAGGAGIAQKCVQVQATATNETGKDVKDAGVFGVISGAKDGMHC